MLQAAEFICACLQMKYYRCMTDHDQQLGDYGKHNWYEASMCLVVLCLYESLFVMNIGDDIGVSVTLNLKMSASCLFRFDSEKESHF